MEKLPFAGQSFDIIVSAGSLSYGDNDKVLDEIYRVLKNKGVFIAIDSLNNNPIYRLNRCLHYLTTRTHYNVK
jgi:ubiquinone/menaquinone biosynthesis C-methylase UbiE